MKISKTDSAITMIKQMIASGALKPGDRLPNEAELSAQLGVSRNSMREATRALQAMQILDLRQGDGTYVTQLDPADMIKNLSLSVEVAGPSIVLNFLETRRTLEVQTARYAAIWRTEAELAILKKLHDQMRVEKNPIQLINLDAGFHTEIAKISNNPVLSAFLELASGPTIRSRIWRGSHADRSSNILIEEHEAILTAIENRDPDSAFVSMWGHITGVCKWVEENPEKLSQN